MIFFYLTRFRTDIRSSSLSASSNLFLVPVIAMSLLGNLVGAASMASGHLSYFPADFKIGDYPIETKFVNAVPIEQHPKVKLNKFPFMYIKLNSDTIYYKTEYLRLLFSDEECSEFSECFSK